MLSIIYSTRKTNPEFVEMLNRTSTCEIEIKEFLNPNGEFGLTKIYNQFIDEAKFDNIVCLHDDIVLKKGWTNYVLDGLNDFDILGVAGSTIIPESGVWWEQSHKLCGRVWHDNENLKYESKFSEKFSHPQEVAVVDGVFIAFNRKQLKARFDERHDKFHFYDVSFCAANIEKGAKIGCLTEMYILHKSIGKVSKQWYDEKSNFCSNYKLPIIIKPHIKVNDVVVKNVNEKLAIIIPTKDKIELLKDCVESIIQKTKHTSYKIYIADTGSSFENLNEIKSWGHTVIEYNWYQFGKLNNDVVRNHIDKDTTLLLFCNNDIKLQNNAIDIMLEQFSDKQVGTVGARLYFEDNTIQHGGISVYQDKLGNFKLTHKGLKSNYLANENIEKNIFGCTGAFLMIRKNMFNAFGMFSEQTLECFEDVMLNAMCLLNNKINIYCGNAVCYHYESQTRKENPNHIQAINNDYKNVLLPFLVKHKHKLSKFIQQI